MTVPSGWTSIHRGVDGFDLSQPDPARDAPLLAVVVMTPAEPGAAAALAAVRSRATGTVTSTTAEFVGRPAAAEDIVGGTGQLIASAAGGIALDAAPGQRVRVLAVDVAGGTLAVVVLVPDGTRWAAVWPRAAELLGGIATA